MRLVFIIYIYIVLCFLQVIYAQEYDSSIEHLTKFDGLASNRIKTIFQDSKGFIWFGTNNGLNRYDGYHYKTYSETSFDSCSFQGNIVITINEDKKGKLWIGTFEGGLYTFDPITECFKKIKIEKLTQPEDGNVYKIFVDNQGIVWVITEHLIIKKYNPKNHEIESYGEKQEYKYVFDVHEDQKNKYLFLDIRGKDVAVFDIEQKTFIEHEYAKQFKRSNKHDRQIIVKDKKGELKIYRHNEEEIESFDISTGKTKKYKYDLSLQGKQKDINKKPLFSNLLFKAKNGLIWKSSSDGLIAFDPEKNKVLKHYPLIRFQNKAIERVNTVLVDQSGIAWIATEIGVYKINIEKAQIQNYDFDGLVETVYEDLDKTVWMGGHWGLAFFDQNSTTPITLKLKYDSEKLISREKSRRPLKIVGDPQGRNHLLWISISRLGLLQFNKQTHEIILYEPKKENDNDEVDIYDIVPEGQHIFWLACSNGLQKIDLQKGVFQWYKHSPDDPYSIPSGIVETVYIDKQKRIWVGTEENGIAFMDRLTKKFTRYKHNSKQKNSISNNSVHDFHEDQKGNFWIATSGGLNLFNRKKETFKYYRIQDVLPRNRIMSILEDREGKLWLGTPQGVSKFDVENEFFVNYDQRDGILNTNLFPRAKYKNKEGKLFLGGEGGVSAFFSNELGYNQYCPPLVITKFKKFNKEISLKKSLSSKGVLTLSHNDKVVSFEIAALNYDKPYKNQYAYKLEGLHNNWISLGNRRHITLTNLSNKKYKLRIKASNNQGVWNEEGIVLPIHVIPPFWVTTTFRIVIGILILLLLLVGYIIHIRFIQSQKRKLEKEVHERTVELKTANHTKDLFFSIVAHDLRGPLTSFQEIPYLINHFLENNRIDKIKKIINKVEQSAKGLHDLLNNLLNWAMIQQQNISSNPERIILKSVVDECIEKYQVSIDVCEIDIVITIPDDILLYVDYNSTMSIIRNLLSNAIKYTPNKGYIKLNAYTLNRRVILEIKDSGIGMDTKTLEQLFDISCKTNHYGVRKEQGSGLGLILCKEFAKLNNAIIEVESELQKGSVFRVIFYT